MNRCLGVLRNGEARGCVRGKRRDIKVWESERMENHVRKEQEPKRKGGRF